MSRDPNGGYISEPASLHKYLYANGDPVNGTDPSGRACDTCEYIKIAALVVWEDYVATKLFYCSFLGFLAADFKITGAYASHTGNAEAGYWLNQTGNALTLSAIFVCSR